MSTMYQKESADLVGFFVVFFLPKQSRKFCSEQYLVWQWDMEEANLWLSCKNKF